MRGGAWEWSVGTEHSDRLKSHRLSVYAGCGLTWRSSRPAAAGRVRRLRAKHCHCPYAAGHGPPQRSAQLYVRHHSHASPCPPLIKVNSMSLQTLRLGAIEELRRNLNRGFLTSHSFDLECNLPDGTLVEVKFKDDLRSAFRLLHPKSEVSPGSKWRTVESPGRHFVAEETYDHEQFQQAFNSLYGWVDRVNEEMLLAAKAHVDRSSLLDLRQQVEAAANNLPEPDKPFTEAELED